MRSRDSHRPEEAITRGRRPLLAEATRKGRGMRRRPAKMRPPLRSPPQEPSPHRRRGAWGRPRSGGGEGAWVGAGWTGARGGRRPSRPTGSAARRSGVGLLPGRLAGVLELDVALVRLPRLEDLSTATVHPLRVVARLRRFRRRRRVVSWARHGTYPHGPSRFSGEESWERGVEGGVRRPCGRPGGLVGASSRASLGHPGRSKAFIWAGRTHRKFSYTCRLKCRPKRAWKDEKSSTSEVMGSPSPASYHPSRAETRSTSGWT